MRPATSLPLHAPLPSYVGHEPPRPVKRLTSPEKFEAQQLIASGVLDVRDYPQFDEQGGLATVEETEEEVLIKEDE